MYFVGVCDRCNFVLFLNAFFQHEVVFSSEQELQLSDEVQRLVQQCYVIVTTFVDSGLFELQADILLDDVEVVLGNVIGFAATTATALLLLLFLNKEFPLSEILAYIFETCRFLLIPCVILDLLDSQSILGMRS